VRADFLRNDKSFACLGVRAVFDAAQKRDDKDLVQTTRRKTA